MTTLPHILALLLGVLPLWLLWPRDGRERNSPGDFRLGGRPATEWFLLLSLGFPVGASLLGLSYFALLAMGIESSIAPIAVVAVLGGLCWLVRAPCAESAMVGEGDPSDGSANAPLRQSGWARAFSGNWILALIATVAVGGVCAAVAGILEKSPHGAWDSWAIWSLRAKFFAAGAGFWENAVDPGFRMSHPEYPVLLSSYLGWAWRLTGSDAPGVPQGAAFAFLLSLTGLVGAGLSLLRRSSLGLMAVPVLLSPIVMVTVPASLYADLPMGVLSFSCAVVLLLGVSRTGDTRLFAIAGVLAAMCAWMKEEGLLHLLVLGLMAAAFSVGLRARVPGWWKSALCFAAGALPLGLLLWWFRVAFAPPSATRFAENAVRSGGGSTGLLSRALDFTRYGEILEQLWALLGTLGDFWTHPFLLLLATVLLLGSRRDQRRGPVFLVSAATLGFLWAGYLASFVLLSGRPGSVLAASLHRVWLHTWPLLVVTVFLAVAAPEDHALSPIATKRPITKPEDAGREATSAPREGRSSKKGRNR